MRILFVSHYATPHIGGIETVVASLRRELRERGHEVMHVASSASQLQPDSVVDDDDVIRVPALNLLEDRLGVPYPIFSPRLARVLAREIPRADVVHAHGLLYMSSVAALRYAKLRWPHAPVRVLTEHVGHVPYESRLLDRIESAAIATIGRFSVSAAERVIVLNKEVGEEMEVLGPRQPPLCIPNGIDTDLFRPASEDERAAIRRELGWDDRPRVLFVGRLVAKKGLDTALAAAAAGHGRFELVVAGPGPLQPEEGPNVKVLGPLRSERVARLFRAADALLLPSRGEGFPVTVQEAMASGLPVVMTNDPSYAGYLSGAGEGVRFVPAAPEAIVRSIDSLVADRESWAAASEAVFRHACGAFSWRQAAERHERLYRELMAARLGAGAPAPVPVAAPSSNGAHSGARPAAATNGASANGARAVRGAQATTARDRGATP